jgi:hypothetical protein
MQFYYLPLDLISIPLDYHAHFLLFLVTIVRDND